MSICPRGMMVLIIVCNASIMLQKFRIDVNRFVAQVVQRTVDGYVRLPSPIHG